VTEYHLGENLLTLYAQLTPWVQIAVLLGLYLGVVAVAYLLKDIVVALTQPFLHVPPKMFKEAPHEECHKLQLEILQKLDQLLTRNIINRHLGIR
jgi:uncharacterized membrane protein YqhA